MRQLRQHFSLVLGERVRLSRELHDTLLQSLVGVALEFDAVSKSLDTSPAAAKERVIKIREQVEEYIREARRSIWSLRSPALETGDLIEALRESAERARPATAVELAFEQSRRAAARSNPTSSTSCCASARRRCSTPSDIPAHRRSTRCDSRGARQSCSVADNGADSTGSLPPKARATTTASRRCGNARSRSGGRLTITSAPGRGTTVEAGRPRPVAEERMSTRTDDRTDSRDVRRRSPHRPRGHCAHHQPGTRHEAWSARARPAKKRSSCTGPLGRTSR